MIGVPTIPSPAIRLRLNPRGTIAGDVTHARRRTTLRVYPLGVLAAGHLEPVFRAGKLHPLHRSRGHHFEYHATSADEVRRTRENLERGHATREHAWELWILRPHRMLGPHVGRNGVRRLVAIAECVHARRRVDAEVRV